MEFFETPATVFANEEDKKRYDEAIAQGKSEKEALMVGDNQQGAWGDYTGPGSGYKVAIKGAPKGQLIEVIGPKGSVIAQNADKAPGGIVDLNPDTAMAIGHSGDKSPVKWRYADDTTPQSMSLGSDLSSAGLPTPVPHGLGGIPGVDRLTPIGDPNMPEVEEDTTPEVSLEDSDVPDAAYQPDNPLTAPAPAPNMAGFQFGGTMKDGRQRYENSKGDYYDVYPDNSAQYSINGTEFFKPGLHAPARQLPKKTEKSEPQPRFDTATGRWVKYDPKTNTMVEVKREEGMVRDQSVEPTLDERGLDLAAAQYRISGTMPALGMGNKGDRVRVINEAARQGEILDQTPAAILQKQAARKADTASLSKVTTMRDGASASEMKAIGQTDIITDLSQKVNRTQFPILNKAILAGQKDIVGDENTTLLYNSIVTFASEYGKIIEGSTGSVAGASESAREAGSRLINAAQNKDTLASVVNLMKREMKLTIKGYDAAINHIYERMNPTSKQSESGIDAPEASATPKPSATPFPKGTPLKFSPSTGKYFATTPDGTMVETDKDGNPIQ